MTKCSVYIPTTGQRDSLKEILTHLRSYGLNPIIMLNDFGKENFWMAWKYMLKMEEDNDSELIVFTVDDFEDLDFQEVLDIHEKHKHSPYAYNIINDGRNGLFNGVVPVTIDDRIMCGFVDCGFFCNRSALDAIGYEFNEVKATKDSSGVGRELSKRFLKARVTMYKPVKSLAYHGDHESIMHPDERKKNPLISR